jgi:hypothetical protein
LKESKKDKDLTELFRLRLDNTEIVPDESVRESLMRKLSWYEFLRFNLTKFNIYYVAGIILVTVITGLIYISQIKNSDRRINLVLPGKSKNEKTIVQEEKSSLLKSDSLQLKELKTINNKVVSLPKSVDYDKSVPDTAMSRNKIFTTAELNGSSSKKDIFLISQPVNSELKGGFKRGVSFFDLSDTAGCLPLKLAFKNNSDSFDSCRWTFGDGGYSVQKDPEWIFDVEGEYKVILNVYVSGAIKATSSANITVYPKPLARFEIATDKYAQTDDEIRVQLGFW